MDQDVRAYRMKVIKIGLFVIGFCYIAANWYATQSVAEACNYHPLLGSYLTLFGINWYFPWDYWIWCHDENIVKAIPSILGANSRWSSLGILAGVVGTYGATKNLKPNTSHGSAQWATKDDIDKSDLGEYVTSNGGNFPTEKKVIAGRTVEVKKKEVKKSGVVVGINPFTHKLMLHDGPEHMLLVAPTRSGKGVNTIIPTGLVWRHSIFFFDPKGELWANTAGYRKKYFGQKVMKFQPLCTDGSGARWNPLAEINFRTTEEWPDVTTVVNVMVKPDGEKKGGGDPFWDNSAASVLNGVIVHLLYKHYKEGLRLPCPSDIMSFLSSPDVEVAFTAMQRYPHISEKEFLEEEILDKDGNPIMDEYGRPKHYTNPLKEIYGEYIKDFSPFANALGIKDIKSVEEIRLAIIAKRKQGEEIDFQEDEMDADEKSMEPTAEKPWFRLLTHPKVAECASNILNGAEQTRASILQTAQSDLAIYQNPVVQKNTEVSDFAIRDLLDPNQDVSLYLVMEVKDIAMVKPLARLFINTLLNKLIRDMKFSTDPNKPKPKKQRLLLMLDEFPQLGNMESIELALAICAGYGIKICIVVQSMGQLNKIYTKDNAIPSNCHVQIYFTPTLEDGGGTAKTLSEALGKKTINTVSHSDGGGGFFKGSDSTSSTGRELMTPDEVSHMSPDKEIVLVAGHKAIFGDKLRYYKYPRFLRRTQCGCPTISDTVTQVKDYGQLFEVHALDVEAAHEKEMDVLKAKLQMDNKTLDDYFKQKEEEQKAHEEKIEERLHKDDEASQEHPQSFGASGGKNTHDEGPWGQSQKQMRQFPHRHPSEIRRRPGMGGLPDDESEMFAARRRRRMMAQQPAPQKEITTTQDALNAFGPRHPKKPPETPPQDPETDIPSGADPFDGDEPDGLFDDEPETESKTESPDDAPDEPDFDDDEPPIDEEGSSNDETSTKETQSSDDTPADESAGDDDELPPELDAGDLFNMMQNDKKES